MFAILPAAGLATRMRGIPKFLLPAGKNHESLIEIHINNMSDYCEKILIPTRNDLIPLLESLSIKNKKVFFIPMKTKTMSETVLNTIEKYETDYYSLVMPDTYFLKSNPHNFLKETEKNKELCKLICWKIRNEQRGKLGEVDIDIKTDVAKNIIDKNPESNLKYAWGALSFSNKIKQYINPSDPHIGYAALNLINNNCIVRTKIVDGSYFDCGTPQEYISLIKQIY